MTTVKKTEASKPAVLQPPPPRRRKFSTDYETSDVDIKPREPANAAPAKSDLKIRLITSFIMIGGFFFILYCGHFYTSVMILGLNTLMFREILALRRNREREQKIPLFYLTNWYFFFTAAFYFVTTTLKDRFATLMIQYRLVNGIVTHINLVFFCLYVAGLVIFVLTLQRGRLRYQFSQFGWSHITILMVITQSSMMMSNVYNGLIWMLLPASLVICNDSFAYFCGRLFGRTPLIKLSPKKTWEGFIGGLLFTIAWAYFFSDYLAQYPHLLCPEEEINLIPFRTLTCELSDVFTKTYYELPFALFGYEGFIASRLQITAMVFGCFAGIIAPFGGFFASGFKRAFRIKDFGDSIPGHGGMTDRFDCQGLMGMFTTVVLNSILLRKPASVGAALSMISGMTNVDQLALYNELQAALLASGEL